MSKGNWLARLFAAIAKFFKTPAPPANSGGGSSPPTSDPDNPTPPDAGGAGVYVVTPGQRVERDLTVPCSLSFTCVPARNGSSQTEDVVVWAVSDGKDWTAGNPPLAHSRCA